MTLFNYGMRVWLSERELRYPMDSGNSLRWGIPSALLCVMMVQNRLATDTTISCLGRISATRD